MKTILLLVALQLAASGGDAYFTDRNQRRTVHHEDDPLAQPFMHSAAGRVMFFSAGAGAQIVFPLYLRRKRHSRLALAAALGGVVDNASGAVVSAKGYRR